MIAVIFEVAPTFGRRDVYLQLAAELNAQLQEFEGFVSIERFESLSVPGKILSLSFWRDEEAVRRWRNGAEHRAAQAAGRRGVFADYRLRVVSVLRDYGMFDRAEVPADSRAYHDSTA
jgi:heme-degrading monooxygenase HmoA